MYKTNIYINRVGGGNKVRGGNGTFVCLVRDKKTKGITTCCNWIIFLNSLISFPSSGNYTLW